MYAKVDSVSIQGVEGVLVEVEVDIGKGLASYVTVGLPDTAVKESRDRILAALANNKYSVDLDKAVVNLAPADLKKEGVYFDLPIALSAMMANGNIEIFNSHDYMIVGELALDGRVRPCKGVLCAALAAKKYGKKGIIIPYENAEEAAMVDGINIYAVKTLNEAVAALKGVGEPFVISRDEDILDNNVNDASWDFLDVKGQEFAKRAVIIAAAGGHNMLMVGPPGSGKSMIAKRIPGVLPNMSENEAIEVTKIHSIAGHLRGKDGLMRVRPFRSPHHTISNVGLIGGGSTPKPGEVSLAHNGVLFLDELPEFNRKVLEVLRQPLEDNKVNIVRAASSMTFPSQMMLIAAMNPCPCGYLGHPTKRCRCSVSLVEKYVSKISGPLMDRIDLHIEIPAVGFKDVLSNKQGKSTKEMKEAVQKARNIQLKRFEGTNIQCNAKMNEKMLEKYCVLNPEARAILELGVNRMGLSARAFSRILKVAQTIADLEESPEIISVHISEALNYRCIDKYVS